MEPLFEKEEIRNFVVNLIIENIVNENKDVKIATL